MHTCMQGGALYKGNFPLYKVPSCKSHLSGCRRILFQGGCSVERTRRSDELSQSTHDSHGIDPPRHAE